MTGAGRGQEDGDQDARRFAPAAARNRDAITNEVVRVAPRTGRALEIASGSGQHVVAFACALPGLSWQPSDPDEGQRASIAAWTEASGLDNVAAPICLDMGRDDWATGLPPADLIIAINLLHLVSDVVADSAFEGCADLLSPGGILLLYGPFLRDGVATSDGDRRFDAELRARDPSIGYKDAGAVIARIETLGLRHRDTVEMPANNLLLVFRRDAVGESP